MKAFALSLMTFEVIGVIAPLFWGAHVWWRGGFVALIAEATLAAAIASFSVFAVRMLATSAGDP